MTWVRNQVRAALNGMVRLYESKWSDAPPELASARAALAALDAVPEGMETTRDDRDDFLKGLVREDGLICVEAAKLRAFLRDHDRLLLEREAVAELTALDENGVSPMDAIHIAEIESAVAAAVAAENEACEALCRDHPHHTGRYLADTIAARRKAPPSAGEDWGTSLSHWSFPERKKTCTHGYANWRMCSECNPD